MNYEKPTSKVLALDIKEAILENSPYVDPGDGSKEPIKKDDGDDGWAATRKKIWK